MTWSRRCGLNDNFLWLNWRLRSLADQTLESLLYGIDVVAYNLAFLLTTLEELNSWYALDTVLLRSATTLVDIDRGKYNVGVASILTGKGF